MELKTEDFYIWYDEASNTTHFQGKLRLNNTEEYEPINRLLEKASSDKPLVIWNLKQLEFLNSSGINVLYKFVLTARKNNLQMRVLGSEGMNWQKKSLPNMKKFLPTIELIIE
ncbi:MAG: hypothetical protein KDI30_00090 [Pseudomonadales bacterium]|nr:hypothetical protein [Pseudomonadales bacterium]